MKRRVPNPEPVEEEDEKPAAPPSRRSRSTAAAVDDPPAARTTRPADDDEDEEEKPRSSRRGTKRSTNGERDTKKPDVSGGWDRGDQRKKQFGSGFPNEWRAEPEQRLFIILEDEPFTSYGFHWVEEKLSMTKKKGFICLESECPLCEIGDRARAMYGFNAYVFTTDDEGKRAKVTGGHKLLTCGNRLFDQLKDLHHSARLGPLSGHWRLINTTGSGGSTGYTIETLKESEIDDVLEELGIDPDTFPSDEELEEIVMYGPDAILEQAWSYKQMDEIASELS